MDTAILYHQNQQLCHSKYSLHVATLCTHILPIQNLFPPSHHLQMCESKYSMLISAVASVDVVAVEASVVEAEEGVSLLVSVSLTPAEIYCSVSC